MIIRKKEDQEHIKAIKASKDSNQAPTLQDVQNANLTKLNVKRHLMNTASVLTILVGLGTGVGTFFLGNQDFVAQKVSSYTIPFNLIVNKKDAPKLRHVSGIKVQPLTSTQKSMLLNGIQKLTPYFKTATDANDLTHVDMTRNINTNQISADLDKWYSQPHTSFNDLVPVNYGQDKQGSFVTLAVITQSDSPKLANHLVKAYYQFYQGKLYFVKYSNLKQTVTNAGGFNSLYTKINNINLADKGNSKLQQYFSKLNLSGVANDTKDLDHSDRLQNLLGGNTKDKATVEAIIRSADGDFNNYGILSYQTTDVPNQVEYIVGIGGEHKVDKFRFVYSAKKQDFVKIEQVQVR